MVDKIYFDMDGVLADFERGIREICGLKVLYQNEKNYSQAEEDKMWLSVKEADHFYDRLELLPKAKEMFDVVYQKYGERCEILTAVPKPHRGIDSAGEDKISWVRRLLSEDVKVNIVLRADKAGFCKGKNSILIDDYQKNILEWEKMGGTGIRHMDSEETLKVLRDLGLLD